MRQNLRETFSDFQLRVAAELSKLRNRISEEEKMAVLKRKLRKALFYGTACNTVELTNLCRDFEKLAHQLGADRPVNLVRRVSKPIPMVKRPPQ